MTRYGWKSKALLFACAVSAAGWAVSAYYQMQERHEVEKMTTQLKTVCVGRFLIDLPAGAKVSFHEASVDGFDIRANTGESDTEFANRVAQREEKINEGRNKVGGKNMESIEVLKDGGLTGKIFVFGRSSTHLYEGPDNKVTYSGISVNGYVRTGGISYDFIADQYPLDETGNLHKLVRQFRPHDPEVVPTEPGFCFGRGFMLDPLTAAQGERVVVFADMPGHPDLGIVFTSMAGTKAGPGLLQRHADARKDQLPLVRAMIGTVREGRRTINGMAGEELVLKVRELNFATRYSYHWELGGKEDNVAEPFLSLELVTGISPAAGASPVQTTLAEPALAELWERITSSVRLRPVAAPKPVPAAATAAAAPLGARALAGERCPQSGWWECNEGGDGTRVLGGQRQYLKTGARMPQALLLPPQTLWQKARGLQPSYESSTPTDWKLVDKRSHARRPAPVALAPATPAAVDGPGAAPPAAPPGSYAKTGAACPASGWWRCEEPNALDGTRWFAQGALLPVATFMVPPEGIGKRGKRPSAIQRRSVWQLVRVAPEPAPATAGELAESGDIA